MSFATISKLCIKYCVYYHSGYRDTCITKFFTNTIIGTMMFVR